MGVNDYEYFGLRGWVLFAVGAGVALLACCLFCVCCGLLTILCRRKCKPDAEGFDLKAIVFGNQEEGAGAEPAKPDPATVGPIRTANNHRRDSFRASLGNIFESYVTGELNPDGTQKTMWSAFGSWLHHQHHETDPKKQQMMGPNGLEVHVSHNGYRKAAEIGMVLRIRLWEKQFVKENGRKPTPAEKNDSKEFQRLTRKLGKVDQAVSALHHDRVTGLQLMQQGLPWNYKEEKKKAKKEAKREKKKKLNAEEQERQHLLQQERAAQLIQFAWKRYKRRKENQGKDTAPATSNMLTGMITSWGFNTATHSLEEEEKLEKDEQLNKEQAKPEPSGGWFSGMIFGGQDTKNSDGDTASMFSGRLSSRQSMKAKPSENPSNAPVPLDSLEEGSSITDMSAPTSNDKPMSDQSLTA